MALTIDQNVSLNVGHRRGVIVDVDFDSSYPTGGESLTASDLGFAGTVDLLLAEPQSGYVFEYDRVNSKLLAYYGDNNNASDGPLIEVPNTTNLSTVTNVRVFAVGA